MNKKHESSDGRLIGAHCSIAGGVANAPKMGGELGCTAIQLFTKNNNRWEASPLLPKDAEDFQKACVENNIKLAFAHTGYLINLASPEKSIFEKSFLSMLAELERAEELELPYVVVHPGSHKGLGVAVGIAHVATSLKKLIDQTAGYRVKILLETTAGQGSSVGCKFEHFSDIFSRLTKAELTRMGICFDTSHAFAAGHDLRTKAAYKKTWDEFDRHIGLEYLKAFHLNDSTKDFDSHVDRHEHIGKGKIGLEPFRWLLNDKRFTMLPMVLETPKGETHAEDRRNLKLLHSLMEGA